MFEIISYIPTPGSKQIGYITCTYEKFILVYLAKDTKAGGIFFAAPSFKPSETADWVQGHMIDSRSAGESVSKRMHNLLKNYPNGYDREIHGDDRGQPLQAQNRIEGTQDQIQARVATAGMPPAQPQIKPQQTPIMAGQPPVDEEPPF